MNKKDIELFVNLLKLQDYKPMLLPFDQETLQKLLFKDNDFRDEILEVITKIDFSNVSFDGFKAAGKDFSKLTGVKLNPQTVYDKDLRGTICSGVEFIGPFDDSKIMYTDFSYSWGVKIDPQKVWNKSFYGTNCSCVEFDGKFTFTDVRWASFKDSIGAIIDPQELACGLEGTICADVEFKGSFKKIDIEYASFKGSSGAKINLDEVLYFSHNDFCDTYLTGTLALPFSYYNCSFEGSNYEEIINFEKLTIAEKKKLSMDDLCAYYRRERKYNVVTNQEIKWIESRKKIHPLITAAMLVRRLSNGQTLTVYKNGVANLDNEVTIKDKLLRRNTIPKTDIIPKDATRPVIFAITHTGKFDIELANEAIKSSYYLLSDDEEYMHRTVDGFFTNLNGVVYVDNDYQEDAHIAKETNKKILNKGGYLMWYPERIWNLSPNQMILYCKTGLVEAAYETDALILPIGIDQRDKEFHINIGDFIDSRNFQTQNDGTFTKDDKIYETENLRGAMATLKWQLWENNPIKFDDIVAEYLKKYPNAERKQIVEYYYQQFVEERIAEWPFITKEDIDGMVFKPKSIVTAEEVFAPLANIKKDTTFAKKVKQKVKENSHQT